MTVLFGTLDHETGNIVPLSSIYCHECGGRKQQCHNALRHFPKGQCTDGFYEEVIDVLYHEFKGDLFTLEQFHRELSEKVYYSFPKIEDKGALTSEILNEV